MGKKLGGQKQNETRQEKKNAEQDKLQKKIDILKRKITKTSHKKDKQISILISELKPLVQEIGDATLIVPLIKEYLEISVKNDEQLIKMATIIQRIMNNNTGPNDGSFGISEEEKQQLLAELDKFKTEE
jgi:hypothetical protein